MTKRRSDPEGLLQVQVRRMLDARLPLDMPWIGGAAGLRMWGRTRMKASAQGLLRRGWPDISILRPDGVTVYVELKEPNAKKKALSKEQEDFRDYCLASCRDIWAECRSVAAVESALVGWGIVLREPPEPGAYDDGLTMAEAFA